MKFECSLRDLSERFALAAGVTAGKGTRPGPQDVLMDVAKDGTVSLSATDLELSVKLRFKPEEAQVEEPGTITIPAARTLSILREIQGSRVRLEREETLVVLSSGKSRFKVVAGPVDQYPPVPEAAWSGKVEFEAPLFMQMVQHTAFATATERVHYSLNGAYFVIEGGEAKMVGTDGRRLALFAKKVKGLKGAKLKGIVPAKGLRLFEKLATLAEGAVTLSLEKNQLFFGAEGVEASTLLIEGTYPDYSRVIPKENDKILEVSARDFLSALRQTSILAGEEAKAVRFKMTKDLLTLFSESVGAGEARVEIPAIYAGPELELQFNPIFFLDFLRQVEEERISIRFRNAETAALLQIGQEYTYVVMPLVTH